MSELSRFDQYVKRAGAERSQYIGEVIADLIFSAWMGLKGLASTVAGAMAPAPKRPRLGLHNTQ